MARKKIIILNNCPKCGRPVYNNEERFLVASDRPKYLNTWYHIECYNLIKKEEKEKNE